MALDLTADQKALGKANFAEAVDELTRRDFMKRTALAGGAVAVAGAAAYFGYKQYDGRPVKAAIIGTGDEGGVLIGEHNPEYLEFVAVCDIRPTNRKRAFTGDKDVPLRKGLTKVYGGSAESSIRTYDDYKEMLAKEKEIEAVVIATPLVSHAPIAIDCLNAGKHVLCEKLMARTISQCKDMIRAAKKNDRILSIGHQRHYSMLYAHASEVLESGILGDVKHIRALWHRNFTWPRVVGAKWSIDSKTGEPVYGGGTNVIDPATHVNWLRDGWTPEIKPDDEKELSAKIKQLGYENVNELIRWRLFNRTGGGLMAELGSHQLDAASIFLGKVHPLSVVGVGTHCFYGHKPGDGKPNPREIDDHIFVTFEFPGKNHPKHPTHRGNDPDDIVVVTYTSISSNGFEPYGECVFGTRGTMIVEAEQNVMLYTERDPNKKAPGAPKSSTATVTVAGGKPVMEAGPTWGGPAAAASGTSMTGPVSRGYREEMEDFAYCVKLWNQSNGNERRLPRCHGEVAMADAIIALASNEAMKSRNRIVFEDDWFNAGDASLPKWDHDLEAMLKDKAAALRA